MALNSGGVAVNLATGGEIKTGMAAAIYDALLDEHYLGSTALTEEAWAEGVSMWARRAKIAKLSNAIAAGVVTYLAANGYP